MLKKAVSTILLVGGGVWAVPVLQDLLTRAVAMRPARDYPSALFWILLAVGIICLGAARWSRWSDVVGPLLAIAGIFVLVTTLLEPAINADLKAPAGPVTFRMQLVYENQESGVPQMRVKGRNESVQLDPTPVVNETHLQLTKAEPDPPSGLSFLAIQLTDEGAALLERATGSSVGRRLGITIDGELISVPKIAERISNGRLRISGLPLAEARRIAYRANGESNLLRAERPAALLTGGSLLAISALLIGRRRTVTGWRMDIAACILFFVVGIGLLVGPLLTFALAIFGGSGVPLRSLAIGPTGPIALIAALALIVVGAMQWRQWPLTLSLVETAFAILILVAGLLVPRAGLPAESTTRVLGAFLSVSSTLFALAGSRWLLRWSRRPVASHE